MGARPQRFANELARVAMRAGMHGFDEKHPKNARIESSKNSQDRRTKTGATDKLLEKQ